MNVLDLLSNDNYVIFNKTLAKTYGIESAIVFGTLCSYQRSFGGEEFFREQEKIIEDTCLSEYLVRNALKNLKGANLINITKKGLPAKYYFQINEKTLIELLTTSGVKSDTTRRVKSDTTNNNININNKEDIYKENNNNIIMKETTIKRFVKPTIADIEKYASEINANIDATYFFDYYESKGWVVGKSPMKDWKASVRLWKSKRKDNSDSIMNVEKDDVFDSLFV